MRSSFWVICRQGRFKVDEYLKVRGNCFAVGDAAEFSSQGKPIRMAVQFALKEGEIAARNIVNLIRGKPRTIIPVGSYSVFMSKS